MDGSAGNSVSLSGSAGGSGSGSMLRPLSFPQNKSLTVDTVMESPTILATISPMEPSQYMTSDTDSHTHSRSAALPSPSMSIAAVPVFDSMTAMVSLESCKGNKRGSTFTDENMNNLKKNKDNKMSKKVIYDEDDVTFY